MEEAWQKHGYPSVIKFYRILKKSDDDVLFSDVDEFVRSQKAHQLHKKTRRQIEGHIVAYCKDCLWFADLLDMSNYSRQNKGYKWILLCIDTFTRKAYAQPLNRKTKISVKEGFETIIDDKVDIKLIVTDSGSEFLNRPVQDLLKELKIEHRTVEVGDHRALGLIDRLSRTIKEIIFKDFTERNNVVWHDRLQDYISAYNSNPHRGILNLTPDEADSGEKRLELLSLNMEKSIPTESSFKVGDTVRKKLKRASFKKGFKQIWGERIQKIKEINVSGVKAVLDNDETVRLDELQAVLPPISESEEVSAVEEADKEHKIEQTIKHKEGLDPDNILSEKLRSESKG